MTLNQKLVLLYKVLDQFYGSKTLVAKNAVEESLPLSLRFEKPLIYFKLFKQFYVFYSIFCQNTNDAYSARTLKEIHKEIFKRNYVYNLELYYEFFYKHKKQSYCAMKKILELLVNHEVNGLEFNRLKSIPRVGLKTSALIYNHFFQYNSLPVVDVHVQKGFNKFVKFLDLNPKTPEKIFWILHDLNNYCEFNLGYALASKLYVYHRSCSCKKEICENCLLIEHNINSL